MMKSQFLRCAGLLLSVMIWTGCASSSGSGGSAEILMRTSLAPTEAEVQRIRDADEKAYSDLGTLSRVDARVKAFEAEQAKVARKKAMRVQGYQQVQAAKMQAYEDAKIAERRATIAAIQKSIEPEFQQLREDERQRNLEVEDVKRRRGLD